LQYVGMTLIIVGGLVTIIVVAAMPTQHATNAFVWRDFQNTTGWSNGLWSVKISNYRSAKV
jgi:choline transport protein